MSESVKEIDAVNIEDELKQSYLDYAMSVIVGRALPDVRDGLKPVHRRVLFAMRELGNDWNKPYKKSARIVGDVIGKYHPHGDTAVYDTIVRMAQPFSMRYMLVDGQGNFGSVDGDAPAAMRYTEVRMAKIASSLLADLDKETVDFAPNYDGSEQIPLVLPARIPNLLVNGAAGIAVGMATNVPPHNLTEVINACIAYIDDPSISVDELMTHIPGPDFPTAAIINGRAGIVAAYKTGRGRVILRARTEIEEDKDSTKQAIIVKELPYQVNKARLIEKIAELVKEKKLEGITALRDESDKDGMRIVIELRRGELPDVILNNLYAHTQMQSVFGINMVALDEGRPRIMNLLDIIGAFVKHRRIVVTRRCVFELAKARARAHILEGLAIALANIDEMITLIKASKNPQEARTALLEKTWNIAFVQELLGQESSALSKPLDLPVHFGRQADGSYSLSEIQAQAILDLRLHRLTGLERDKISEEYRALLKNIQELLAILSDPVQLMAVIRAELQEIHTQFGDARRTEILSSQQDLTIEDLIMEEDRVLTLSYQGYAKSQSLDVYSAQHRGGKGKSATAIKEEDFIAQMLIAHSHDNILCFSSHGKVYWLKTYQFPQASRTSQGRPMVNLLPLGAGERITAMLPVKTYDAELYVFMATAHGVVKKTALSEFSRPRANGIIALELLEDDQLIGVAITNGSQHIMLFTQGGKVLCAPENTVRSMGRTARGVRGIKLATGDRVISLVVLNGTPSGTILTATEKGYGKRTLLEDYRISGRAAQGVISIQVNERNGQVTGAIFVQEGEEVMLISDQGTLVRTRVDEISIVGRNTQGVRLMSLSEGEKLIALQSVAMVE